MPDASGFVYCILTPSKNFYNRALTKVQKVGEKYRKMDDAFKDACVVFGENPKTKEPSEFFQTFIDFMNQFKVGDRDVPGFIKQFTISCFSAASNQLLTPI